MLTNYLTTFFRTLQRQKFYSIIKVMGLGIGIAAALLIQLYVANEFSYDRFHEDANRIYRVGQYFKWNGLEGPDMFTPSPLAEVLQKNIAAVESATRIHFWKSGTIRFGEKTIVENQVMQADSNFFDFFSFNLLYGDPTTALKGPNKVIITRSVAIKFFGSDTESIAKAIGSTFLIGNDKQAMEVTGIAEDPPTNSHFHFSSIVSMQSLPPFNEWISSRGDYTYIKPKPNVPIKVVEQSFPNIVKTYFEPDLIKFTHKSLDDLRKEGSDISLFTQPLTSIHLTSHADNEIEKNGDLQYCYLMVIVAMLIIILACVNFINLSTARATTRVKEIGVRKAVGAIRQKIIKQHLLESFLYTALGFFVALTIVSLTIAPFNILTSKTFAMSDFGKFENVSTILALFFLIGTLAGAYPAFYLSRFKPTEAIRGRLLTHSSGYGLRRGLVIVQFVISISLIISSIFIYKQLELLLSRELGFDKENVIYNLNAHSLQHHKEAFINELQSHKEIISCSFADGLLNDLYLYTLNKTGTDQWIDFYFINADSNFVDALGLQLTAGRFFSPSIPSDSSAVVINETAAIMLGITDLSLNSVTISNSEYGELKPHQIIGIIKDINFQSLRNHVKPLIILPGKDLSKIMIRLKPGSHEEKIALIRSVWKKYSDAPFEYGFLDEKYASLYEGEQKLGKIGVVFSGLAIFIASLGLLGLVTYMASQRTKEIGIRKVLGASIQQVVVLLSEDFIKTVMLSLMIALPLSFYFINKWLQSFPYRVEFDFALAAVAGTVVLAFALALVFYQCLRAATGNPVESLRSE